MSIAGASNDSPCAICGRRPDHGRGHHLVRPARAVDERCPQRLVAQATLGACVHDRLDGHATDLPVHEQQSAVLQPRAHDQEALRCSPPARAADGHPVAAEVDLDAGILQCVHAENAVHAGEHRGRQHRQALVLEQQFARPQCRDLYRRQRGGASHAMHVDHGPVERHQLERQRGRFGNGRTVRTRVENEPEWSAAVDLHRSHDAADTIVRGARGKERAGFRRDGWHDLQRRGHDGDRRRRGRIGRPGRSAGQQQQGPTPLWRRPGRLRRLWCPCPF